jgi:hypothetical protein
MRTASRRTYWRRKRAGPEWKANQELGKHGQKGVTPHASMACGCRSSSIMERVGWAHYETKRAGVLHRAGWADELPAPQRRIGWPPSLPNPSASSSVRTRWVSSTHVSIGRVYGILRVASESTNSLRHRSCVTAVPASAQIESLLLFLRFAIFRVGARHFRGTATATVSGYPELPPVTRTDLPRDPSSLRSSAPVRGNMAPLSCDQSGPRLRWAGSHPASERHASLGCCRKTMGSLHQVPQREHPRNDHFAYAVAIPPTKLIKLSSACSSPDRITIAGGRVGCAPGQQRARPSRGYDGGNRRRWGTAQGREAPVGQT